MEQAMRGEFRISKKNKAILVIGTIVFFFLTVFTYYKLFTDVNTIVRRQAVNSITNISQLNADSVSRAIENRRLLLKTIADKVELKKDYSTKSILKEMEEYVEAYDFYTMGVLKEDLTISLTTGAVLDASGVPLYKRAWDTKFHISDSYLPIDGGKYALNTLSYPLMKDGELKYVLIATYYSKNLTQRMNISSMDGKGYNFLLDSKGAVVIYPRYYQDEEYNGLMKYINDFSGIIPRKGGDLFFEYNGEEYYAHFEKLEINDWYLMTCAREADVFVDAHAIMRSVFMGMGILWLLIVAAILVTIVSNVRSKQQLREAVYRDSLLQIGNGNLLPVFFDKLDKEEFTSLTLTVLDIDRFKEFNYIYGEEAGDNLLRYIVDVIQKELPEDYLFRYLSDTFVLLIHCENKDEYIDKFERVIAHMIKDIDTKVIQPFDISAGVRRMREGETLRRVMSDALIAKGTVKGIQVQQYAFYDESILQKRMDYMTMESDFSRALREKEFHVYYQPKYDMRTGRIIGAEALVRWVKADGTIISPGAFIPCFEASRQIIRLDEMMLESVCQQMNQMEKDGLEVRKVSVNLSRVHLRHHGILTKIEHIVTSSGVDPSKLSFEITESALYEDSIPLKYIVDFLHKLGCKVDMDDYGVGVSGPNALAANKFDVIKMDKSFIDGIGDQRMEAVIQSTIHLSRTLGMEILAEGVEEKYQADSLVRWGCTIAQGFYYSPPVPEKEYRRLLAEDGKKEEH